MDALVEGFPFAFEFGIDGGDGFVARLFHPEAKENTPVVTPLIGDVGNHFTEDDVGFFFFGFGGPEVKDIWGPPPRARVLVVDVVLVIGQQRVELFVGVAVWIEFTPCDQAVEFHEESR